MKKSQLFINGKWIDGRKTFVTNNPSTGERFGEIYLSSDEEIGLAVSAASKAFINWRNKPIEERISIVSKVVDYLKEEYGIPGEETYLKTLISDEMGKRLPEADIEVTETGDMIDFFVRNGTTILKPRIIELNQELWPTKRSKVVFEPIGVVAIIKAWNYPLELPSWSLAPALIAGNTVVFKPSEHSTFVAEHLVKLFEKAGIPPGVLNLITGNGETGRLLVDNNGINMVSFTGSVKVGTEIAVNCASRNIRYKLELGGNDPAIVTEDANIELTSAGLVWGAFCNSGQVCTGIKRVFMSEGISDRLIPEIIKETKSLKKGRDFGPIISRGQLGNIEELVSDAVGKGALILSGGNSIKESDGYYYEPTVLTNISPEMKFMNEECFGPLMPIILVKNDNDAIEHANNSIYGLGASIWTSNEERANTISRQLEVGMIWINDVNIAFPEAPWTATKSSGNGIELSEFSFYEYVIIKHINEEFSKEVKRAWWYPY